MLKSFSLSLSERIKTEYGGWEQLRADCTRLGLDGVEGIWGGEAVPDDFPHDLLVGYHLTFFPDWLDFYKGDKAALIRKYGSMENVWDFYGGADREALMQLYREDLERARRLGAKYVVFHVSDVSIEEGYTYRWLHSDEEVIDVSAQIINELLKDIPADFEFLVENQWWPGFTFTDPRKTERLMSAIQFGRKGIMLDTGHLLNTNPSIRTQADGVRYIRRMLSKHGELAKQIRGVHLHQSLSGNYVRKYTGSLPENLPTDCVEQFGVSYAHIQQIDRHRPWTDPEVAHLLQEIMPAYLTHELAEGSRDVRLRHIQRQINTLRIGETI